LIQERNLQLRKNKKVYLMAMLEQRLEGEYQIALKNKNSQLLGVLRLIKAAIKNEQIANKRAELTDEDIIKILRRELKKRQESMALFKQGNRQELADKEASEAEIIRQYLPQELNDEAILKIIQEVIAENNFSSAQDFGKVMKLAVARISGQAEGNTISRLVKQALDQVIN
jgi:uncharacterized protein